MEQTKFTGCKHLRFDSSFEETGCKKIVLDNFVFWRRRSSYDGCPVRVQFCNLRGRLNSPIACICKDTALCGEYDEQEHVVTISE